MLDIIILLLLFIWIWLIFLNGNVKKLIRILSQIETHQEKTLLAIKPGEKK